MAMPIYKVEWVYQDTLHDVGWTERFWINEANHGAAFNAVALYVPARLLLMMNYIFLTAVKVTDVDTIRDSLFGDLSTYALLHGDYDPVANPPAGYDVALLVRRDSDLYTSFGKMFLHGMPDAIFGPGRQYIGALPANWAARFGAFLAEIKKGIYLLRNKATPGPWAYTVCTHAVPVRETTHKMGRPFDLLRGRRRIA